jgi:steroid 5-alpha reductase family enzyme
MNKSQSLLVVVIAYVVAMAAAIFSLPLFDGYHVLIKLGAADVVATIVIFIFSYIFKNSSLYDPYWSVIPPFFAYYFIWQHGDEGNPVRQWIVFGLVTFWGVRLTLNWARRWEGLKDEDWRYLDLASKAPALKWLTMFSAVHLFPTLMVLAAMLPLYPVMLTPAPLGIIDVVASLITFFAVVIEWAADNQLWTFIRSNKEKGAFVKTGLWAYSRHPNYFGECMFWTGIFLFTFSSQIETYYWVGIGFLTMWGLFLGYSVPAMDKRHKASRPGYAEYASRTSGLIPWFPRK